MSIYPRLYIEKPLPILKHPQIHNSGSENSIGFFKFSASFIYQFTLYRVIVPLFESFLKKSVKYFLDDMKDAKKS